MIPLSISVFVVMLIMEVLGGVLAGFAIGYLPTARTRFQKAVGYIGIGYMAGTFAIFIVQTQALWHLFFR